MLPYLIVPIDNLCAESTQFMRIFFWGDVQEKVAVDILEKAELPFYKHYHTK